VTVDEGSNVLAGTDPDRIVMLARAALSKPRSSARRPHLWDGHAAVRIAELMANRLIG